MIDEENKKREALEILEVSMTRGSYPRKGKEKDRKEKNVWRTREKRETISSRTAGKTKSDYKKMQRSWRMGDVVEDRGVRWSRGEVEKTRTGRSRGGA